MNLNNVEHISYSRWHQFVIILIKGITILKLLSLLLCTSIIAGVLT